MKLQKVAAIISAAALALILTGCGNDPVDNLFNNPQNGQSSGTTSKPVESKPAESKPTVQLPDIPVNEAAAFEYKYDSELGGMVITDYKLQSPKVHIPDLLENEKVVKVDFREVKKDITHIIMPDSVQAFGFSDTIKGAVQFVNIPASVTELESKQEAIGYEIIGFFEGCGSLPSVTIPDSVISIGYEAFRDCTGLTSVTIGNGVTKIYYNAFEGCTSLTSIDVANGNPKYCSFDGILCEKNEGGGITLYTCPEGKSGSIVIPDSVTEIGSKAFND